MVKQILPLIFCLLTTWVKAYDKPNSIAYKASTKAYFISNLAGKSITMLDSNFDKKEIITGLIRPKDILLASFGSYNGLLILDSNVVKVYDADGFSYIATFKVPGAMDLEDAEMDKTKSDVFYMSDPTANKIFKVVVGGAPFYIPAITVLDSSVRRPKAMLFDRKNRLLVTSDTLKSAIYNINLSNGSPTLIQTTSIDYINSIEEDLQGNFYATSWGDSYFYRLDKNFKNAIELAQYSKPAGMCFNKTDDVIVLACSNCNKIEFHKLHMVYLNDVDTAKCAGDSFNINSNLQFKGKGTYNAGNIFYVELSDGNGKFSSATLIGSIKTNAEPNSYRVALPFKKRFHGNNYKLRIRSTNPVFYSLNDLETVVPYIPISSFNAKDTVFFCNPSMLGFGLMNDPDSGYVKYTWAENGKSMNHALPYYTYTFANKSKLSLVKSSLIGRCFAKDSTILIPISKIVIPYKDTFRVCEKSWLALGGDSMANSKIEWSSKQYPNLRSEFKPSYQIHYSDTFLVKISSTTGSCSSQKNIFVYAMPRPDYYDVNFNLATCSRNGWYFQPSYIKGNVKNIEFKWKPSIYLRDTTKDYTDFMRAPQGHYTYKFMATDTVYHCYDSIIYSIRNVTSPIKPILGKNMMGVVIKNYDKLMKYSWYKGDTLIAQTLNDSQFVVPNGVSKWGSYRVIVSNNDSIDCSDTSELLVLTDPGFVNTPQNLKLNIYPNPANDKLFIKDFKGSVKSKEFVIYNAIGQAILSSNTGVNGEINISKLLSGMYRLSLTFEGLNLNFTFIKN